MYNADKLTSIDLGRQGENLARTVEIDVSGMLAQWPDAVITLLVKRKHDAEPYIADTTVKDGVLFWPITTVETADAGDGKLEIRATCGEVISRAWVTGCRIVRVETLFFQPLQDFLVELYVQAVMRMEIVRSGQPGVKHTKTVRRDLRLQYRFDLRPCKLTCQFTGVILNEADSLLALNPEAIRADKYLLPILREEDYPYLADMLLSMDGIPKGALLDAEALVPALRGLQPSRRCLPKSSICSARA